MKLKMNKKRLFDLGLCVAIIALGIAADQITKLIAAKNLKGAVSFPLINGVLQFTYVENTGAAFGMMKNARWLFMTVSIVAILAMAAYLFLGEAKSRLYTSSIAIIISGGIGNMIDRIALGYVVDFIDFCLIDFAVFNVADSLVCIGAGLLILALVLDVIRESREKKNGKKGQAE